MFSSLTINRKVNIENWNKINSIESIILKALKESDIFYISEKNDKFINEEVNRYDKVKEKIRK